MNDKQELEMPSRGDELRTFLLVTVIIVPAMAVASVAGYGFVVWMLQIIQGPPS